MAKNDPESQLLRGALIPSFAVGVVAIAIATFAQGKAGFFGALLAQFVVVIFFAVHLLVSRISTHLDPMSTFALALFSYFAKLFLLTGFLIALTRLTSRETIDRTCFGLTAVALTFAWLGGEIASYLKLRLHLPLPNKLGQESQQ
jgi:ATP synthase protein I